MAPQADEGGAHPFSRGGTPLGFDGAAFETRLRRARGRDAFSFPLADIPDDFKRSGVLIPMWREDGDIHVLLTRRSARLRTQPGQMAFPGGRLESGENWVEGALRETWEEVGIPADAIDVIGPLDDAWSGARHHIVPIVGWLDGRPDVTPSPDEVESVHMPSIRALMRPEAWKSEEVTINGVAYHNATIDWDDGHVFGLSTDLLVEAMQWGFGLPSRAGEGRLSSLRAWLAEERTGEPRSAQTVRGATSD